MSEPVLCSLVSVGYSKGLTASIIPLDAYASSYVRNKAYVNVGLEVSGFVWGRVAHRFDIKAAQKLKVMQNE